jgi:hypothetical protein
MAVATPTSAFSLSGPAAGDYAYAPNGTGGVNYFRGTAPITNAQYDAAQSIAGTGLRSGAIESAAAAAYADNNNNVAPTNPNNNAGGSNITDNSGDIALQNAGLDSVDASTNTGIAKVNSDLAYLTGQYGTEGAAAEADYSTNSNQNENNLQTQKQAALIDAAQGRSGLFGTLASLGALNGSGVDEANDAVKTGANSDLATAGDTYATNQSGLDASIGDYRLENQQRIDAANQAAEDDKTAVNNAGLKASQTFDTNLANDYKGEGNDAQYNKYAADAASLYPQISTTNLPTTNLTYTGNAYTAPTLASYLGVGNNTSVSTSSPNDTDGSIPGLFAVPAKKVAA